VYKWYLNSSLLQTSFPTPNTLSTYTEMIHIHLAFCQFTPHQLKNNSFYWEVLFPDGASFTVHGPVYLSNTHYWSAENPQWRVNVWCSITGILITGPHITWKSLSGLSCAVLLFQAVLYHLKIYCFKLQELERFQSMVIPSIIWLKNWILLANHSNF